EKRGVEDAEVGRRPRQPRRRRVDRVAVQDLRVATLEKTQVLADGQQHLRAFRVPVEDEDAQRLDEPIGSSSSTGNGRCSSLSSQDAMHQRRMRWRGGGGLDK